MPSGAAAGSWRCATPLLRFHTEVVDTFADARQNDLQILAEEMEDEIEHDRKALAKLFAKIDKDNSGQPPAICCSIFSCLYILVEPRKKRENMGEPR